MPDYATALTVRRCGAPVAHLVTEDGAAYGLTNTPEQAQLGGHGINYTQVPRQGLKPLVRRDTRKVRTMTFTHHLADALGDPTGATDLQVLWLMMVADTGWKLRLVNMSGVEGSVYWYVTDLAVTVTRRHPDQTIAEADLAWQLIEAFDERPAVGRVPTPAPPPAPAATPSPAPAAASSGRTHTVVKGDTLWALAGKYLGQATRWPEIYKANSGKIKDPHWIYPGQVFAIPAK